MTEELKETNQGQDQEQGQFALMRIYLKDASFEVPGAPKVFLNPWNPEITIQLGTETNALDEDNYEVVLSLTVSANNQGSVAFLIEIKQAGIFLVKSFPEPQKTGLLGSYCPSVLFPYAREAISDLVGKGSFPQLLLAPINFDSLLAQKQMELSKQQNTSLQ